LANFWLLWERKQVAFNRSCYLAGIVASSVYNVHRVNDKQHFFEPIEFVPRPQEDAKREEIIMCLCKAKNELLRDSENAVRRKIQVTRMSGQQVNAQEIAEARRKEVSKCLEMARTTQRERLTALGRNDVEEILERVFK